MFITWPWLPSRRAHTETCGPCLVQFQITRGQGADASHAEKLKEYSLTLKVHGVRDVIGHLNSGLQSGIMVETRWVAGYMARGGASAGG